MLESIENLNSNKVTKMFHEDDNAEAASSQAGRNGQKIGRETSRLHSASESFDEDCNSLLYKSRSNSERSMTLSYSSSCHHEERNLMSPRHERSNFGPKLPVTLCILFTELCERLVYYGVSGNLLIFLTNNMSLDSALASSIVLVFTGWCHF